MNSSTSRHKKILIVSNKETNCGVHDFGVNISRVLLSSKIFKFIYAECSDIQDLYAATAEYSPDAILYNYHPTTLPWLRRKIFHKFYWPLNLNLKIPQVGVMHEVTQQGADKADNSVFDYHVAPDPTLLLKNPIVFKTGRLIPPYTNKYPLPGKLTVGSFGFATPNKGFEEVVKAVQNEFDEAIIRFNIPFAEFGDKTGENAKKLVAVCKNLIYKKGIELQVSHDFLSSQQVLDFLAQNSVNIFLYQDKKGRGLSSTVDFTLAVGRPVVVSDSIMFRHLHGVQPSIVYGKSTIKQIIENGIEPLQGLRRDWNSETLRWEYERIFKAVFEKSEKELISPRAALNTLIIAFKKIFGAQRKNIGWIRDTETVTEDNLDPIPGITYKPVEISKGVRYNRILDDQARALYADSIVMLTRLVPHTMAKKIPAANVQQGFVFDTVFRLSREILSPKILCVGSYEDTAFWSLQKLGFQMEGIDLVTNYSLQDYITKPGVEKGTYNIIFSTSVIEHDPDDESFIIGISNLLAPGGTAVLTCDYNDQWKSGDPKPEVDARLYTQRDFKSRLLPLIPDCELVDFPDWDCPHPDFLYLGKYRYAFASLVFRKKR